MSVPVLLHVKRRRVLLAGYRPESQRWLFAFIEAGATVTLATSAELPLEVRLLIRQRKLRHLKRRVQRADIRKFCLVLASEVSVKENRRILAWAAAAKVWGTALPASGLGDFELLQSVRRPGILVAFAELSRQPGLSIFLRRRLQRALPRWLKQAPRALPKLGKRLIRGWDSVARNHD